MRMSGRITWGRVAVLMALASATLVTSGARADAVTDWNVTAGEVVTAAALLTPPANRVMAVAHTAAYEAANAVTKQYPVKDADVVATPGASVDAAIAAAHHTALVQLLPSQAPAIEHAYRSALDRIADDAARSAGIATGEMAARSVLARQSGDEAATRNDYRPRTTAGAYVPTIFPAVPNWSLRKPWLLGSSSQIRPGPPPALTSDAWARDYDEVKAMGGKDSARRSAEQTEIARFWEATLPPVYHGVVRCIAAMPGRNVTQNARLFAAVTQATDDALIAVFEAKYHYGFWRPVTAIRNGDIDDNDATARDSAWLPLIDTPMHPEYPCAHCIVAASIGAVLQAEIGDGAPPELTTTSTTAAGAARSWSSIDAFVQEVANARVYAGVHYRFSTEAGMDMGKQVGALAVARHYEER